ncbi:MAG: hypothetical protein BMS9Abin36_1319 [Gammaproteobacteria bacterium]|nr:MAG: hypothetical protein BMS9Abin36_1319 [Gammaproteobacteria bacterium]
MARIDTLRRFRRSFTGRLMLGILVIHFVMLPLLFGGVLYIVQQGYQNQFVLHVRLNASRFASLIIEEWETKRVQELLDDAVFSGHVVFAEATDQNGRVVADAVDQPERRDFKEDFFYDRHGDDVYYAGLPLVDRNGIRRGELRLGYDETSTEAQIALANNRGLYLAAAYVLLSFLLVFFWGKRMTRSLEHLRRASRKIASGQLEEQLEVKSDITELQDLVEDLNFMRSELMRQTASMEHLASHDSLTGLPNRMLLSDRLQQTIASSQRNQSSFAFLLMDLNDFKEINDTLGHLAGDLVLQEIAVRLRATMRRSDTVARLGGDEFAIILPAAQKKVIEIVAQKLHDVMEQTFVIENQQLQLGGSFGVALFPDHGDNSTDLMRHADVAMYEAKRIGSSCVIFRDDLVHDTLNQLTLAGELRKGIARGDMVVYYQPKIDLRTGTVRGAEALVRWQHPKRGLISPNEFIAVAERTGLIEPLTFWVIDEAMRQVKAWRQMGLQLDVAVNLSARSLHDRQLPDKIEDIVRKQGADMRWLELELTESMIVADSLRAEEILSRFHEQGIKISIDDFGTGYSSLAHLQKLPVSVIKIDRSFVMNLSDNENDAAIVRATIELGHALGLTVVAEGVEHQAALLLLQELGCDLAQGYYFAPPCPAAEFEQWYGQSSWFNRLAAN